MKRYDLNLLFGKSGTPKRLRRRRSFKPSSMRSWEVVVRLRPTLFVAIITVALLALPGQILELYMINVETIWLSVFAPPSLERFIWEVEPWTKFVPDILQRSRPELLAMLTGVGSISVLWLSSIQLISVAWAAQRPDARQRRLAVSLVVAISLTPILGTLIGLNSIHAALKQAGDTVEYHTSLELAGGGISVDDPQLRTGIGAFVALSLVFALITGVVLSLLTFRRFQSVARIASCFFSTAGMITGLGSIGLITAAIAAQPVTSAWWMGTQALVNVFVASLAFVLTCFSQIYYRTGFPLTLAVLSAAFLFSALGWNDNHRIEYSFGNEVGRDFETNARAWLMSRNDLDFYVELKKPYPVYVVAAEGGGMYAAYHAASWLANIQDRCPGFAQHTFAISSVSGGSLGSAVFASLARRHAENTEHRNCDFGFSDLIKGTERFFSHDLLSPLVASTLFPDLLQRLLPWPFGVLDRARGLEAGFTAAWENTYVEYEPKSGDGSDPDAKPIYASGYFNGLLSGTWKPTGAAPALFLNTTSVQTGSRVSISPLKFKQTATAQHISDALCSEFSFVDLPLVTAVSLSARFPWLTPPGWFDSSDTKPFCADRKKQARVYLADGGYFENSGLETAIELATFFEQMIPRNGRSQYADLNSRYPYGIDVRIIVIFSADRALTAPDEATLAHVGEIMSPIDTMLATRTARTRAIHLRAVREGQVAFSPGGGKPANRYIISGSRVVQLGTDEIHQVGLDRSKYNLPLGWSLSTRSIKRIAGSMDASAELVLDLVEQELSGEPTEDLKKRLPK
jgi:hypothetical protein